MDIIAKKCLEIICDYLKQRDIKLSKKSRDGRVNSSEDEDILIPYIKECVKTNDYFIKNNLSFVCPQARYWYDFCLYNETIFIPVNIKTSELNKKSADNLNSKESIGYALTGIRPEEQNMRTWKTFNELLKKNTNYLSNTDYYYLIMNKNDNKDVFFNSLKCIETLISNGNNLPFQCNWSNNRKPYEQRSNIESIDYILDIYEQSNNKKRQAADISLSSIARAKTNRIEFEVSKLYEY